MNEVIYGVVEKITETLVRPWCFGQLPAITNYFIFQGERMLALRIVGADDSVTLPSVFIFSILSSYFLKFSQH